MNAIDQREGQQRRGHYDVTHPVEVLQLTGAGLNNIRPANMEAPPENCSTRP
jgi:hypothetical protein